MDGEMIGSKLIECLCKHTIKKFIGKMYQCMIQTQLVCWLLQGNQDILIDKWTMRPDLQSENSLNNDIFQLTI